MNTNRDVPDGNSMGWRRRLGLTGRLAAAAWLFASLIGAAATTPPAMAQTAAQRPVTAIATQHLAIGDAALPLYTSDKWSQAQPTTTRAVIVVHGIRRNAEAYLRYAEQARDAAGARDTLLIAPQFLDHADIAAQPQPAQVLYWRGDGWKQGDAAAGPVAMSSFTALDALLQRLADPAAFPALRQVVIAGHSAGGQFVQRYAFASNAEAALTARGIAVRYVVANPSSYLWFGELWPRPADHATCPALGRWPYGLADAPSYVGDTAGLERRFIRRDVLYLLGEADRDPAHKLLDRSCAAEAQGESRFARGMLYDLYLEQRWPNQLRHRIIPLPGVAHDAARVFASVCGMGALFARPGCRTLDPPG